MTSDVEMSPATFFSQIPGEQNWVGGDFLTNDFDFMAITSLVERVWRKTK